MLRMSHSYRALCALCAAAPLIAAGATAPPAPLPAEKLAVAKLPARNPHWIYLIDESLYNDVDARIVLYDADQRRVLGQIDAGYYPSVSISADGNTTIVATTYFARGSKGTRTDVAEFTDNATLDTNREIVLPPKHAQTYPTPYGASLSDDGRFLYVANITPATSTTVVDLKTNTVAGELDTAGCVFAYPAGPNRVSSLCESGKLLTISLDASGKETSRAESAAFFETDKDPVFAQGLQSTEGVVLLSFLGQVHEVNLAQAPATIKAPWSLVTDAERGKWRPGGNQMGALHRGLGRLYVPMHQGGEGTHKDGGSEIWVFDMATHKRLARWPVAAKYKLDSISAVQVSQDQQPLLFAVGSKGDVKTAQIAILDARTGDARFIERDLNVVPWLMLNP
jgi:methylamine dehydrogenase heavy chain